MKDERIIRQYETTMAENEVDATKLCMVALNELSGKYYNVSKKVIDEGIEYCIAKWKRIIELCEDFSERKKEELKQSYELSIRFLGIWCKDYLLKQRRLAS